MNPENDSNNSMNIVHDETAIGAPERLARIDLNLLVAFDALAREKSVTRAAQRTGVTQSAMSHALGRLRELLSDPLFLRGQGGMVLTPRAEALVAPVRGALVSVGRALAEPPSFEPASARRAFRVASPDLFDVLVIPPLLERVRAAAPGVDMAVTSLDERRLAAALETGEVDVGIVPRLEGMKLEGPEPPSQGLVRQRLFFDRFVCLLRADHPCLRGQRRKMKPSARAGARARLSLDDFVRLSHVLVSPTGEGRGFVDQLLEARGLRRRIALRIPHFYSALAIVASSDLVVTAPNALAYLVRPEQRVIALAPPLSIPAHGVYLVWHERFSKEPGHAWFRKTIAETARELQTRI